MATSTTRSPTARSLDLLRWSNYTAGIVEAWIPGSGIRRDLFGIADLIAIRTRESGALLVQATSLPNISTLRRKAMASQALRTWLSSGGR